MKKKRMILWIITILWMGVIFKFSSDVAGVSDEKSGTIVKIIKSTGIDIDEGIAENLNHWVRKAGHFCEYAILAIFLYLAVRCELEVRGNVVDKKMAFQFILPVAIVLTSLYACSDEFHQLFVQGRSGELKDVLLDTVGGSFGGFLIFLVKN